MPENSNFQHRVLQIDLTDIPADKLDSPILALIRADLETRLREERTRIFLHEAAHVVYSKHLGFKPRVFGPAISYNRESREFRSRFASVELLPPDMQMTADALAVAKTFIAPIFVMKELFWQEHNQDMQNFRAWYIRRFHECTKAGFRNLLSDVLAEVLKDLQSPEFRAQLQDTTHKFEHLVFGESIVF